MLLDETGAYRFEDDDDAWHTRLRLSAIPRIAPVDIARYIDGVLEPEPRDLSTASLQKYTRIPLVRFGGATGVYGTSPASLLSGHVVPYGMLVERCAHGVYDALNVDQYVRLDGAVRIVDDDTSANYVCTFIAYVGLGARDIPTAPPTGLDGVLTRFANTWLVQPFDTTAGVTVQAPAVNVALELDALLAGRSTDDLQVGVVVRALAAAHSAVRVSSRRSPASTPPAITSSSRMSTRRSTSPPANDPTSQRIVRAPAPVGLPQPNSASSRQRLADTTETSLPRVPAFTRNDAEHAELVTARLQAPAVRPTADLSTCAPTRPTRAENTHLVRAGARAPMRQVGQDRLIADSRRLRDPTRRPLDDMLPSHVPPLQRDAIVPLLSLTRQQQATPRMAAPVVPVQRDRVMSLRTTPVVGETALLLARNVTFSTWRPVIELRIPTPNNRPTRGGLTDAPPATIDVRPRRITYPSPPPLHGPATTTPLRSTETPTVASRAINRVVDTAPPSLSDGGAQRMLERAVREEIMMRTQADAALRLDIRALNTSAVEQRAIAERALHLAANATLIGSDVPTALTLAHSAHSRLDEVWSNVVVIVDRVLDDKLHGAHDNIRADILATTSVLVGTACTAAHTEIVQAIDGALPARIERALDARADAWTALATTALLEALPFPTTSATQLKRTSARSSSDDVPWRGLRSAALREREDHAIPRSCSTSKAERLTVERLPMAGCTATALSRAAESRLFTEVLREARVLTLDLLLDIDTSRLRDAGGMLLSRENVKRLGITTDDIVEGSYLFYSTIIALRDVRAHVDIRDLADAAHLTVSRSNIARQGINTDDIVEGSTHLYYTEDRFDQSFARADERRQALRAWAPPSSVAPRVRHQYHTSPTAPHSAHQRDEKMSCMQLFQMRREVVPPRCTSTSDRPPAHVQTRGIEVRIDALAAETRRRLESLDGNVASVLSHATVAALGLATGEDVTEGVAGPFATCVRVRSYMSTRSPLQVVHTRALPLEGRVSSYKVPIATQLAIARRTDDVECVRRFDIPTVQPASRVQQASAHSPRHVSSRPGASRPDLAHPLPQPAALRPLAMDTVVVTAGRHIRIERAAALPDARPISYKKEEPRRDALQLVSSTPWHARVRAVVVTANVPVQHKSDARISPRSTTSDIPLSRAPFASDARGLRTMDGEPYVSSRVPHLRARGAVDERDDDLRFSQARSQALGEVVRRLDLKVSETRHAFLQFDDALSARMTSALESVESTRAKMDTAEAVVSSFDGVVQALVTSDALNTLRVASISTDVAEVASSVLRLDMRTVGEATRVTAIQAELTTLVDEVAMSAANITAIALRVDEHVTLPAQLTSLQAVVRASAERIVNLHVLHVETVDRVDDIEDVVRAHTTSIANAYVEIAGVRALTVAQDAQLTTLRADFDAGVVDTSINVARLTAHDVALEGSIDTLRVGLGAATGRLHVLEAGAREAVSRDHALLVDVTELFDTTTAHRAILDAHTEELGAIDRVIERTVHKQSDLVDEAMLARTRGRTGTRSSTEPLPCTDRVRLVSTGRPPTTIAQLSVAPPHRAHARSRCELAYKAQHQARTHRGGELPPVPNAVRRFSGVATRSASPPPTSGSSRSTRPDVPSRVDIIGYEWSLVQHGIGDLTLHVRSPPGTPVALSVRVLYGDGQVDEIPMAGATATVFRRRLTRASAALELRAVSSAGVSRVTRFEPSYDASFVDFVDLSASTSFVARFGSSAGLSGLAVVRDGRLYHDASVTDTSAVSYVVFTLGVVQRTHVLTLEFPSALTFCTQIQDGVQRGGLWLNLVGRGWLDACAWWVRAFNETPTLDADPCLLRCDEEQMMCTLGLATTNPDGFSGEIMVAMAFAYDAGGLCIPRLRH